MVTDDDDDDDEVISGSLRQFADIMFGARRTAYEDGGDGYCHGAGGGHIIILIYRLSPLLCWINGEEDVMAKKMM